MRLIILALVSVLFLASPLPASAQSFVLQGAAGPTLVDRGYSLAAGAGVALGSRVTLLGALERTHLFSRTTRTPNSSSTFRGGTFTSGTAELQVSILHRDRVGPYALVGFVAGVSRPTVNSTFPSRVSNDVRALSFGGGVHAPLGNGASLFADARLTIGAEAGELLAQVPLRAGIAWQF
jgi:hypothetical protein